MVDQKWLTTSAGVKMPRIIYGTAWKKDRTADLVPTNQIHHIPPFHKSIPALMPQCSLNF